MSNYDLLKQKISEAVPRLLEMSKGQLFTIKNMPFYYEFLHFIYNDDEEIVEIATLYNGEIDVFDYEYFKNQQVTIYGKEPILSDVLEWIKIKGVQISDTTDELLICFGGYKNYAYWNLSKPYLKEQSKDLIDYLCTLD